MRTALRRVAVSLDSMHVARMCSSGLATVIRKLMPFAMNTATTVDTVTCTGCGRANHMLDTCHFKETKFFNATDQPYNYLPSINCFVNSIPLLQ